MEEPSVKLMLQPGVLFFRCLYAARRGEKRNESRRVCSSRAQMPLWPHEYASELLQLITFSN
jgi:hypothetical protein